MKRSLLVASLVIAFAAAAAPAQALPGVGYFPLSNAMSRAGTSYGCAPYPLNVAIDPWANGVFDRTKMEGRYGPCWQAGAPGPHSTDYANYLRTAFAARTARWNPDYNLYDGNPTEREVNDAYYTGDSRVTPTQQPQPSTPVSAFGWAPNTVYVGTQVSFTDASSKFPNAWQWSFQGGSPATSTAQNPVVTWSTAGTKTVTLRASNNAGAGTTLSKTINVLSSTTPNPTPTPTPTPPNPTPTPTTPPWTPTMVANFSFSPSVPHAHELVSFDAGSSIDVPAGTDYAWNFGDGVFGNGKSVSHAFAASAYYSVRLTLTPPGCSAASCKSEVIKAVAVAGALPPSSGAQPQFSVSPPTPGAAESAVFDSAPSAGLVPGSTFTWLFNDGSPIAIGPIVDHAFPAPGSYNVVLSVAPPGCTSASCLNVAAKVVTVGARPPVLAEFTADTSCQFQCAAATGRSVTLRATDDTASSYTWTFGDGSTALGRQVYHSWMTPGTFTATLATTKGTASASKSRQFVITGTPPVPRKTVLLPWVAQTRNQPTLVQSSDLYVLNPGTTPLDVTLTFRQRGFFELFPAQVPATIAPGGMVYMPDMVRGLFGREDVAGFLTVTTAADTVEPVLSALNSSGASTAKLFGNAVPGSLVATAGGASSSTSFPVQHLVGLSDSARRQSSFGLTNPTDQSVTYRLRFFDSLGREIGDSGNLELDRFAQRVFGVQELRDGFGVAGAEDYRVEVETVSGPAPVPFGSDLWLTSGDPTVTRPGTAHTAKAYLLGVVNGAGPNRTTLQTDLVLANVGGQTAQASLSFTKASNKAAGPTLNAAPFAVPAGTTTRLDNVLLGRLGSKGGVGVLTVTTTSIDGTYPVVLAESFDNTNPSRRFGQTIGALGDADIADATRRLELVGLRNDKATKATLFLFNPNGAAAEYDLVYRAPNGAVLGTLKNVRLAAGQLRQLDSTMHPTKKGGSNGFSVEVVVKSGKALAAAQLVRTGTGDPSYVVGVVR